MIYPRYEVCLWSDSPEGAMKRAAKALKAYRKVHPDDDDIGCVLHCQGDGAPYRWAVYVTTENEFERGLSL